MTKALMIYMAVFLILSNFNFFSDMVSLRIALQILSPIAGATALYGLYRKVKKRWLYIKRLRKKFINNDDIEESQSCYLPCGMMKIFCAFFHCQCCCHVKNVKKEDGEKFDLKTSKKFSRTITTISDEDLNDIKKKYVRYRYSHKHYCFLKDHLNKPPESQDDLVSSQDELYEDSTSVKLTECCDSQDESGFHEIDQPNDLTLLNEDKNSDNQSKDTTTSSKCIHYQNLKCKNMLIEPVLYPLILDFDKLLKSDLVMDPKKRKKDKEYALKLAFQAVLEEVDDYKFIKAYKNIQDSLVDKSKNICLVLKNFPNKYKYNFNEKEKFLLDAVLDLNQKYKIQLIYKLQ